MSEDWDGFGEPPVAQDQDDNTTEPGTDLVAVGKRLPDTLTVRWIHAQLPRETWEWIKDTKPKCKINGYLIESMCKDAKKGASKRAIMARAGYHVSTWNQWEAKAQAGEQPYLLWYQCIMHAMASIEEDLLESVRVAALGDWKAAKWMLEQINKDEYSPTPKSQTVNIAGDVHQKTDTTASVNYMSNDTALEVAKLLQGFGVVPEITDGSVDAEVVEDGEEPGE